MNIRPIKNEKGYRLALKRIEQLWNAKPNSLEGDELDVLSTLVENYEEKKFEILPPDPIEAIKFRMDQLGMKKSEAAEFFGGKNRVSEILKGKRNLTIKMVRSLHKALKIPAESLIA